VPTLVLAWLAVLEDATAILIDLPDRRFGVGTLHGSGELGLLFRQAEAEDGVHFRVSRMWNARLWRERQMLRNVGLNVFGQTFRNIDRVGQGDWQPVSAVMPPRQHFRGQKPNRTAGKRQPAVGNRLS